VSPLYNLSTSRQTPSLNALATVLLIAGLVLIKRRRETAHKWTHAGLFWHVRFGFFSQLSHAPLVSEVRGKVALWQSPVFPAEFSGRANHLYLFVLIPHVILAAARGRFLALATIYLGLAGKRIAHRKLAKWTFSDLAVRLDHGGDCLCHAVSTLSAKTNRPIK